MYKLQIMVDQEWLDILDVISRNQEGFVWVEIDYEDVCSHCGGSIV
jgi:hypothetical protein